MNMGNDIINSDKLLFICASPAGGGFRLGRLVSCFDKVHWYADDRNGKSPWDIFCNRPNSEGDQRVTGKDISPYHYDRYVNGTTIPLVGERIERYWNVEDLEYFYNTVWFEQMKMCCAQDLLNKDVYVSWVVHDSPDYIASRFPNAKIINLIDSDFSSVVERYKSTTALFPIILRNKKLKPAYKNEYANVVDELLSKNKDATYRDYWAWTVKNVPVYDSSFDVEYTKWLFEYINNVTVQKENTSTKVLNINWNSINIEEIKMYLSLDNVDDRYKILLSDSDFNISVAVS